MRIIGPLALHSIEPRDKTNMEIHRFNVHLMLSACPCGFVAGFNFYYHWLNKRQRNWRLLFKLPVHPYLLCVKN